MSDADLWAFISLGAWCFGLATGIAWAKTRESVRIVYSHTVTVRREDDDA